METLDQSILLDLASKTGQRCAVLPPDFAQKMQRRLQRKFKVKVATEEIANATAQHVAIYRFAASALQECLLPNDDIYASLSHIDDEKFMAKLGTQFPAAPPEILNEIAHWVIQYEYLR